MTPRTFRLRDRCRGALRRSAIAALAGAMAFVPPAQACTSFLLRTSDGGVVYGRTMEFGFHLTSEAIVLPRQFAFTATGPGGKRASSGRRNTAPSASTPLGSRSSPTA